MDGIFGRYNPAVTVNLLVAAATAITVAWLVTRSRTARARARPAPRLVSASRQVRVAGGARS